MLLARRFQDWKDCLAVEFVKGPENLFLDGPMPPSVCEVVDLEVSPVRMSAFFSKTCDVHQLHVYDMVPWLRLSFFPNIFVCFARSRFPDFVFLFRIENQ